MKNNAIVAPCKSGRLLALDIMRGITIAGMLLVNNPGSWGDIYAPLRHADWNGLTPTDLVFPFFMFIMGVSAFFSMRKYDFKLSWNALAKVARRTVLLFAIGLALAWFGLFVRGIFTGKTLWDAVMNFGDIRILGVIPRLALCYGIGTVVALAVPRRSLPWLIFAMLAVYALVLLLGRGYEESADNIIAIVDVSILGENHMYTSWFGGEPVNFDPEGLLSTLPSVAHMLIGYLCGSLISRTKDNTQRISSLFIVGTILTFAGFLLSYGLPINKKVWSPTFVLTTCGLAASLLALLIWIIDIRGHKRWCRFFDAFGINPLFLYCFGTMLAILIGRLPVSWSGAESGEISITGFLYQAVCMPVCGDIPVLASLMYAVLFVLFCWCVGYILYKKKIYIKI